jgi:steroid 5-alpha reductase family enzyme
MIELSSFAVSTATIALFAGLGWLLSLRLGDVSIVDSMWSLMFLLISISYALAADTIGERGLLVLVLVAVWAIRLSAYITWRNWGDDEDARYQEIRERNQPGFAYKSLYLIFGFQGLLALVISLPLLVNIQSGTPLGWLDYAGVALWVVGMIFEAGGDWQLARFRANADNRGKVLDSGLWSLTRHPNYFGDFCVWWGFFLLALSAGGWWTVLSPLLMSFMLLKVSGVALLEKDIGKRRPEYARYVQKTNAFFPGPKRSIDESKVVEGDSK